MGDDGDLNPLSPWVEDTTTEAGWDAIRRSYAGGNRVEPLEQIIRLAKGHDVRSVVIERRYVDADWRSMHAKFYGSLFQRYAPTCHRLHLFSEMVSTGEDLHRYRDAYKGFTIMRPIPSHPVGRTMIKPPPGLSRATFCLAPETARPLGYPLLVEAMPFMSQDGEYMRCSHVVQWMVLHHAHLVRNFARRLPEEIQLRSQGGLVVGRQVPSGGLSLPQMLSSLHALGLSPDKVLLPPGGQEESRISGLFSLPATLCRYVNSQMPPIVISEDHAWVVVGYRNRGGGSAHDNTSLFVHDDMGGPYVEILDPWAKVRALEEARAAQAASACGEGVDASAATPGDDAAAGRTALARRERDKGVWSLAVPPLPQRVNLSADRAEFVGRVSLMRAAEQPPQSRRLLDARDEQRLTFRTYAIRSNEFKAALRNGACLRTSALTIGRPTGLGSYGWSRRSTDSGLRTPSSASWARRSSIPQRRMCCRPITASQRGLHERSSQSMCPAKPLSPVVRAFPTRRRSSLARTTSDPGPAQHPPFPPTTVRQSRAVRPTSLCSPKKRTNASTARGA